MIKQKLIALLLIICVSSVWAQNDASNQEALFQKFMNAYMGPGTNLQIGVLPEGFDIEFPDTITVLGTISRGDFPMMPPMPVPMPVGPIGPMGGTESHEILLDSELGFTELSRVFDDVLEAQNYKVINLPMAMYDGREAMPHWGFINTIVEEVQSINKSYCNERYNVMVNGFRNGGPYQDTANTLRMNINMMPTDSACEEQIQSMKVMEQTMMAQGFPGGMVPPPFAMIEQMPDLSLSPPKGSLNLTTENIPQFPTPDGRVAGIKIGSGWSSRTVLATPIMGEDLRNHYDKQLKEQGWQRTRQDVSGPLAWSEWRISGEDGTEWGGFLQVMSDSEWQKGVAMPIFFLLERP